MNIRGIDRMEFGLDINKYRKKYDAVLCELHEKKEEGHNQGTMQDIEFNNLNLSVGLTGMRFYAYRITCKDFMLAFAEKVNAENPVIRVIFYSGYLWSYGYLKAYENFLEWFSIFPGTIEKNRLSRLDICIDTDEIAFTEADKLQFITRAKSKTTHYVDEVYTNGKKFTGFTVGRGKPMLARIYNKTEEIKTTGKDWFKAIWYENGWDGKKDVWRIEFQLRREALKELGIDKVEDIKGNEERLWNYLSNDWLKMNDSKWEIIKKTSEVIIKPLIRQKVKQGDLKRLTNQTNGLVISIGAYTNNDDIDKVLTIVKNKAEANLKVKKTDFKSAVQKRRSKYLADESLGL